MSRLLLAFALLFSAALLRGQDAPPLEGRIEGHTYVSPTGLFKVTIPVLPELGGQVTDTPNVVTFRDAFNTYISIAVFPQDATQRWELSTRGTKDYLAYFMANFVLGNFKQSFPGSQAESAVFVPTLMDGSLLAYITIPGGSMFMNRAPQIGPGESLPVAKRGNLVFLRGSNIFIVSTELAERIIEGKVYNKTPQQEDKILRQRLEDIANRIQFLKPAAKAEHADTTAPAPAAPAASATPSAAPAK